MAESEIKQKAKPVTEVIGDAGTGMRLKVRHARVKVVKGPDKGLVTPIPQHGLLVGKGAQCDLVLGDETVSTLHFQLMPSARGFRLQDLGSSNGTWVQDFRVGEAYLNSEKKITAGTSTVLLQIMGGYEEYPLSDNSFMGSMVGQSLAMRQVFALLERAAVSDSTLLLEGESGTGKELAAEAVHGASSRARGPFIVVDCGNMQAELVESQLFGHVKGAYTGATRDHVGAFEAARGGTVFLDEIGELNPELQPKLLRVLENRQVRRVGENVYRPVDVRVIAATNRNLKSAMESGRFRQDLYYRLSVLQVHLPPLRDRRDDIPLLARSMVNQMSGAIAPEDVLSEEVLGILTGHSWPGNVRELRNAVERLVVFSEWSEKPFSDSIESDQVRTIPESTDYTFHDARNLVIDKFEREYAVTLLERCKGVVSRAAKKAGVTRPTFHRLIKKHGIVKMKS